MSETVTGTVEPGGPVARPADAIAAEVKEAAKIETAETKNAALEAEAAKASDPAAQAAADPQPEPQPKVERLPAWAEKRMADEAAARREASRRAKALEEEVARLQAQAAAAQAGQTQPATPAQPALQTPAGAPHLAVNPQDFDRAVAAEAERRAAQLAATEKFNADCNAVHAAGKEAYKEDFDAALSNLAAVGALNEQALQMIIATGEGPRLLYELGSTPDKAAELFALPPAKFAIELGKRAATKPAAKAPAAVSNAPAPIKAIEGTARISTEPRDDDDDAAWFAKRREQRRGRFRQYV